MYKKPVQLYCIYNTITTNNAAGYCAFFYPLLDMHNGEAVEILGCQSSNLSLKLRLSVTTVVKATLLSKQKSEV